MTRLFATEDFEFLRRQRGFCPAMARRLRSQRCDVFALYLQEAGQEFRALWRLSSPHSGAANAQAARQFVMFHCLCAALLVKCRWSALGGAPPNLGDLERQLQRLRQGIQPVPVKLPDGDCHQ
jgi:hypothetical protein